MNEQFKKLREQALKEVDYLLETEGSENGAVMYREHLAMVNQRFAELIVRECAKKCEEFGDRLEDERPYKDLGFIAYECADGIKRMFGVEQ